jgi:opacity protein-like surface antigen
MAMSVLTLFLAASAIPIAAFQRPGHPPDSAFQARFGGYFLSGDSNFWDETGAAFTLDPDDLDGFMLGFSWVHSRSNTVEFGVNLDFYEETERSEYRDYVDMYGNSIFHDTQLSLAPVTVDVRFIPGGRYRIRPEGRFNPKPVFYIGAGIGMTLWEYEEYGDFIFFEPDGEPGGVFYDYFDDDGVAFEVHALAGVEVPLSRSSQILFEGRYSIADDDLGGDFSDLNAREIDLGGTGFFAGFSFRF